MGFQDKLNKLEQIKLDNEIAKIELALKVKKQILENQQFQKLLNREMKLWKPYVLQNKKLLISNGLVEGLVSEYTIEKINAINELPEYDEDLFNDYSTEEAIWYISSSIISIGGIVFMFFSPITSSLMSVSAVLFIFWVAASAIDWAFNTKKTNFNYWSVIHKISYLLFFKWYFLHKAFNILLEDFATNKLKNHPSEM